MIKCIWVYILFFLIFFSKEYIAQTNLVANPSFEDTAGNCDFQMIVDNPLLATHYVKNWCTYKNMTPDYYNSCSNSNLSYPYPNPASIPHNCYGYQYPKTGNAYIGLGLYWLNYLPDSVQISSELAVIKLNSTLKANRCYYGEFYVSSSNINAIVINQLGMLLSQNTNTTVPFVYDNIVQPQIQWDTAQFVSDTLNWIKVSGTFMSQGGEQFLSIGNFRDGAHVKKQFIPTNFVTPCGISNPHSGSYVYIDDVALYELPQTSTAIRNYTICLQSDSLVLGDTARAGTTYQWFANGIPISNQSQITIKPNTNTTYVLQTTACSSSTQSFVVTYNNICPPEITELIIPNTFTPNDDDINDVFKFDVNGVADGLNFAVYNRWGNLVASKTSASIEPNIYSQVTILWDGRTTSGEPCTEGVYFYTLKYTDTNGEQQAKNGYVSLFR